MMYCPQCGTPNQDDAISCHTCGTSLNEINDLVEKPVSEKASASTLWLGMAGLVLGTLAVFPYLVFVSWHLPRWRWIIDVVADLPGLGVVVFYSAFFLGLPFGITAIVLAALSWRRSPTSQAGLIFAVTGILLGLAGSYGHYWFFATCPFCQ